MLQPNAYGIIRFRADNPDKSPSSPRNYNKRNADSSARVWLIHCHIEFHVVSGFIATIIEAPEVLGASGLKIPQDHLDACKAYPMLSAGNAAGNTQNPLDLTGSVTEVSTDFYGYVVTLLFSLPESRSSPLL